MSRILRKPSATNEPESDMSEDEPASSSSSADDFEALEKIKPTVQNGNGKTVKRKKSAKDR